MKEVSDRAASGQLFQELDHQYINLQNSIDIKSEENMNMLQ
tara:strand:- start:655 stop:777 length:123 start_codon:yes stop_codon:yes gene_type:complete